MSDKSSHVSRVGSASTVSDSLYTRLVSSLLFPLHERLKRHSTIAVHAEMEKHQWWPREQLMAYQQCRLVEFIQNIAEKVPYYQQLFEQQGIDPKSIAQTTDLARLPFLTKEKIRAHSDQLKAKDASGLARFNTGGSSGEPLIFYIGKQRISHDVAAKRRATRWWGVDIGDPEIVIWGSPIELGGQDYVKLVRDFLLRTELLSAFEMSPQKLTEMVNTIENRRPKMLFGYPSAFSLIAQHADELGVKLDDLGIKVAFVTSEKLYDHQRQQIEASFGCPVANGYGGRDAGFIAHQCPEGGMHITADDIIVEIVDPDGNVLPNGEAGEIVTTHLATGDYPFLRYRTGDIGVLSEDSCPCGRGLPLLEEIQGRSTDFILAADGTLMHGLALIYVIRELEVVEQFKIVQESVETTTVYLVVNPGFTADHETTIAEGFKQRLGAQVDIEIRKVDRIPAENSGKMRYVVSHAVAR